MNKQQMLMSILDEFDQDLNDSVMEDVAREKPAACITIKISGPGATKMIGDPEAVPAFDPDENEEGDELDARLASVSRGRNTLDGGKRK